MTRHVFMNQLNDLNNDVIKMGSMLELSLNEVIIALEATDKELAETIIKRDDAIDHLEQQIERDCISIIAKQQPLASDLRKVSSIMKIITDLERIADHCEDISEYIIALHQKAPIRPPHHLSYMVRAMKTMVIQSIDSFVEEDAEKASEVIHRDDEVDRYFEIVSDELIDMMQQNPSSIPQCVCYLMVTKYLERMSDHATNIAEWIIFIVTGELVVR